MLNRQEETNVGTSIFIRATEISEVLEVSKTQAYKIIRQLNAELEKQGYMTVAGRASRQYFNERFYGVGAEE